MDLMRNRKLAKKGRVIDCEKARIHSLPPVEDVRPIMLQSMGIFSLDFSKNAQRMEVRAVWEGKKGQCTRPGNQMLEKGLVHEAALMTTRELGVD